MITPRSNATGGWLPLLGIAAIVGALALAFAWASGWIGGRLTGQGLVNAIEAGNPRPYPGFRRAHAKGVCVAGTFRSSGEAVALSAARVFAQAEVPVLGRLSIAGSDPHSPDGAARVSSLALLLRTDDGAEWRTAMNSFPFFPYATPQGFHAQLTAGLPDPKTGKPDPARVAAVAEAHPEVKRFQAWAAQAPWPDSWATTEFNGVNAFRFRAADGAERYVRWSMRPQAAARPLSPEERAAASGDFLESDLGERLAQGRAPRWDLVLTIAEPGDAVEDPSQPWPDERRKVVAGTLEVSGMSPQASGPCRDVNFDPLIVPDGIAPSRDPVLLARGAAYSQSFNRRQREIARGTATLAVGAGGP